MLQDISVSKPKKIPPFPDKNIEPPVNHYHDEILEERIPTILTPHSPHSFYSSHRQLIPAIGDDIIHLQHPIQTIEEDDLAIEMDESRNISIIHNCSSIILTSERKERKGTKRVTKRENVDNIQIPQATNEALINLNREEKDENRRTQNDNCCRICLESEINAETGEFISPCECTGSVKYVHEECLKKWIASSRISIDKAKCELCHVKLLISINTKQYYCYKQKFTKRDYQGVGLIVLLLILLYILIHLMVIMIVQM